MTPFELFIFIMIGMIILLLVLYCAGRLFGLGIKKSLTHNKRRTL